MIRDKRFPPPFPRGKTLAAVAGLVLLFEATVLSISHWRKPHSRLSGLRAAAHGIVFSDKHELLAVACADKHLYLYANGGGEPTRRIGGHQKRLTSIATFPQADVIATGSADGSIKLWQLPRGIESKSIQAHPGGVRRVRFSGDGGSIASIGEDHFVRVWDASGGNLIAEASLTGTNDCLAINPSGTLIGYADGEDGLVIWSVAQQLALERLRISGLATAAAFDPTGSVIAVGLSNGHVQLWSTGHWRRESSETGHNASVNDLAFSSDGERLFSVGDDGRLAAWEVRSMSLIGRVTEQTRPLLSVSASESGRVATGGYGPSTVVWKDPAASFR